MNDSGVLKIGVGLDNEYKCSGLEWSLLSWIVVPQ